MTPESSSAIIKFRLLSRIWKAGLICLSCPAGQAQCLPDEYSFLSPSGRFLPDMAGRHAPPFPPPAVLKGGCQAIAHRIRQTIAHRARINSPPAWGPQISAQKKTKKTG